MVIVLKSCWTLVTVEVLTTLGACDVVVTNTEYVAVVVMKRVDVDVVTPRRLSYPAMEPNTTVRTTKTKDIILKFGNCALAKGSKPPKKSSGIYFLRLASGCIAVPFEIGKSHSNPKIAHVFCRVRQNLIDAVANKSWPNRNMDMKL